MMAEDKKCLVQWHDYNRTMQSAMQNFRLDEELLDCTLACDGYTVRAHKLVLAASSQYFRQVFKDFPCKHPTIILEGLKMDELLNILHFMYSGKILVDEEDVVPLLIAAGSLSVDGLSYVTAAMSKCPSDSQTSSGYEGSPLDLNEEHSQENKLVRTDESSMEEKDEDNKTEVYINHDSSSAISVAPTLKRLRIIPDSLPLEEDFPKKSCSENYSKNRLPPENVIYKSEHESTGNEISQDEMEDNKATSLRDVFNPFVNNHLRIGDRTDLNNDTNSYKDGEIFPDNVDFDCGPPPLPPNHPAVVAAAMTASSNGVSGINYAALLAAGVRSQMLPSAYCNGSSSSLPAWPNNERSASPPNRQEYVHPMGHSIQDIQATLEQYQRKLAFHEPRPCPTCKRMYRDAATLRTHIAIMHFEGKEPFACTCGSLFRTKYDMYQHKKNGHR